MITLSYFELSLLFSIALLIGLFNKQIWNVTQALIVFTLIPVMLVGVAISECIERTRKK